MDTPTFESSVTQAPPCFEKLHRNEQKLEENIHNAADESIQMQTYNIVKDLSVLKRGYDLRFALILMTIAFFFVLAAFLGSLVFFLYALKDYSAHSKDHFHYPGPPNHVTQKYEYIGLADLNSLPLTQLEEMQSVVLQWGKLGSGKDKQYYYNILSAYRDGVTNTTTLDLSNQHSLVATNESAVLLDKDSNVLGVLDLVNGHLSDNENYESSSSGSSSSEIANADNSSVESSTSDPRRLGLLHSKSNLLHRRDKNDRPPGGPPADMFDAYCRYGCGGMAVTFPYYYRPHFGYGYPLVGTQSQFPQGYGGYAGAPIMREAHNQYIGSTGAGPRVGSGS